MLLTFVYNLFRPVIRGRPSARRAIYICGWPRWVFVLLFSAGKRFLAYLPSTSYLGLKICLLWASFLLAVSFILWVVSCGLITLLWALAIGLLGNFMLQLQFIFLFCIFNLSLTSLCISISFSATLIHASFRTPNLKARLNTFREEFRAVWRNYSEL